MRWVKQGAGEDGEMVELDDERDFREAQDGVGVAPVWLVRRVAQLVGRGCIAGV